MKVGNGAYFFVVVTLIILAFIAGYVFEEPDDNEQVGLLSNSNEVPDSNISEESILVKEIDRLTLDSSDLDSGYRLNKRHSGYVNWADNEYFIKIFARDSSDIKEKRDLVAETYVFHNSSLAQEFFQQQISSLYSNQSYRIVDYNHVGDTDVFFERYYYNNFYPFKEISKFYISNNVVFELSIKGHNSSLLRDEFEDYFESLIRSLNDSSNKNLLELKKTDLLKNASISSVSIRLNGNTSRVSKIRVGEEEMTHMFNFMDSEYNVEPIREASYNEYYYFSGEDTVNFGGVRRTYTGAEIHSYEYSLIDSRTKEFFQIPLCINSSDGVTFSGEDLLLTDQSGNKYTTLFVDGSLIDLSTKTNNLYCDTYIFSVFKSKQLLPKPAINYTLSLENDRKDVLGTLFFSSK